MFLAIFSHDEPFPVPQRVCQRDRDQRETRERERESRERESRERERESERERERDQTEMTEQNMCVRAPALTRACVLVCVHVRVCV